MVAQVLVPLQANITLRYGLHQEHQRDYIVTKFILHDGQTTNCGHYSLLERRQAQPGVYGAADRYVHFDSGRSTSYSSLEATPQEMAAQMCGALLIAKEPPRDEDHLLLSLADPEK